MRALRLGAVLLVAGLATAPARSASPPLPALSDFSGTWRIARMVGASDGGVTGGDPKAVIGRTVHWTATEVRSPEGVCQLRKPAVTLVPNRTIETGIWGGQSIDSLALSKAAIAQGFGPDRTPVFQDQGGCANGILIGRGHMIEAFGSGWIYRLDRTGS